MNLYKIQETFGIQDFNFDILLNKNLDYDFIILDISLCLGILSVQNLKPVYIKLQIKNKSKLVIIENETEKISVLKPSIIEFITFKNINFVGQVSNDGTLYMNKYWRYAEKFKTQ